MRFKIIILFFFVFLLFTCNNKKKHNYPNFIIEKKMENLYDSTIWNFYALLGSNRTQKHEGYSDTLCLSADVIINAFKENDSLYHLAISMAEFKNSNIYACFPTYLNGIPDEYYFNNKELIKARCGQALIFDKNHISSTFSTSLYEQEYNAKKIADFPKIIKKYKDQLNPWLKAEAQRRGIID